MLSVDFKHRLYSKPADLSEQFNQDMFEDANAIRDEIFDAAGRNIKKVQAKEKRDFDSRRLIDWI